MERIELLEMEQRLVVSKKYELCIVFTVDTIYSNQKLQHDFGIY